MVLLQSCAVFSYDSERGQAWVTPLGSSEPGWVRGAAHSTARRVCPGSVVDQALWNAPHLPSLTQPPTPCHFQPVSSEPGHRPWCSGGQGPLLSEDLPGSTPCLYWTHVQMTVCFSVLLLPLPSHPLSWLFTTLVKTLATVLPNIGDLEKLRLLMKCPGHGKRIGWVS